MIRHYEYYVDNFSHAYVLRVEDLDDVKGVDLSLWYEILPDARDQVRRSLTNYKFISRLGYDCTDTKKASFKWELYLDLCFRKETVIELSVYYCNN